MIKKLFSQIFTLGILLAIGCGGSDSLSKFFPLIGDENSGKIKLNLFMSQSGESHRGVQTILPAIDMEAASYDISGSGPNGGEFSTSTTESSVEISGLHFGEWTIQVSARNDDDIIIGQGSEIATVHTGQTEPVFVTVTPVEGHGDLELTLLWNAEDTEDPSIEAELIPHTGAPIVLDFEINGEGNTGTCELSTIPTGYYTLVVKLLDNGILTMGAVEVVRIVNEETTIGSFEFYDINQPGGNIIVNIELEMADPIEVTLSGTLDEIEEGDSMIVEASVPEGTGNVTYVWYINAESKATGSSYDAASGLSEGVYRLDVTAFTSDGKRAGSATHTFTVTEATTMTLNSVGTYKRPYGAWGFSYETFVAGNYLYVICNSGLKIFDITDPNNAVYLSTLFTRIGDLLNNFGVYVSGSYAYIADDDNGLQIIDISDKTAPVIVGNYDTPGEASGVYVSGNYAYIADQSHGLQIIDISDKTNPTFTGSYDTPTCAEKVSVSGNYSYIADKAGGLQIIDISDPSNPTLAAEYDTNGAAYGLYISGSYAYIAVYNNGLEIVDISDPTNPTSAGNCDTSGHAYAVYVSGSYAYVADFAGGLEVINVSDPTNPTSAGNYDTDKTAIGVYISGSYAYVSDYAKGVNIIDISDPTTPISAGKYVTSGLGMGVYVSGDYSYIADWTNGLVIVDISDPTNPTLAGNYITPGTAMEVFILGSYAYVADGYSSSLQIIDISDPTNPTLTGNCDTDDYAYGVYASGSYAYIADDDGGLQIIDISDPTNPTIVGNCNTPGDSAHQVYVSGNYAYVTDGISGLQIIDISDKTNPTITGNFATPDSAMDIHVSGTYAYVTTSDTFQIVDISDPTNPTLVGDSEGGVYLHVSGSYAYLSYGIIDISDPTNPTIAYTYSSPCVNSYVSGSYLYVTAYGFIDWENMMYIYEVE